MGRALRWLAGGVLVAAGVALVASLAVSRPLFDERLEPGALDRIEVAPLAEALTFARTAERVLLVTRYERGEVTGIDLGAPADPLATIRTHGIAALRDRARGAETFTVPESALVTPIDAPERNYALGLNFSEHARESGLEEPPFLFPKYALPTRFDAPIRRPLASLLDYEVELGAVLIDDVAPGGTPAARLGFVLCNDVTDRWSLVRNFERATPMGTTGFADGKSGTGFAPVGPLLVVPDDPEAFYRKIMLRLWLNGRLRQQESASAMHWGPRRALDELLRRADVEYLYRGRRERLLASPQLAAGTLLLLGTPAGVIFKPLNLWNPWVYLRPGDELVLHATYLGTIRNRIEE